METAHSVSGHTFPAQVVFGLFDIVFCEDLNSSKNKQGKNSHQPLRLTAGTFSSNFRSLKMIVWVNVKTLCFHKLQ